MVLRIIQLADDRGNALRAAAVNMYAPVRLAGLPDRGPRRLREGLSGPRQFGNTRARVARAASLCELHRLDQLVLDRWRALVSPRWWHGMAALLADDGRDVLSREAVEMRMVLDRWERLSG